MHKSDELKDTNYELFVLSLSVLALFTMLLAVATPNDDVRGLTFIFHFVLGFIFLIDFLYRLLTAHSRMRYFFLQFGWADLLSALPFPGFQMLRLFRVARSVRMLRRRGIRRMLRTFLADRAGSSLLSVLFLIICVIEFGSIAMIVAERRSPDANIKTPGDALWWSYVTITTVGYGDRFPVTAAGRVIGIGMLTAGVGLFGVLSGFLANVFLTPRNRPPEQPSNGPAEPASALTEIRRLLEEQERVSAELRSRLAAFEQSVGQDERSPASRSETIL
jgi:voltage-gated potassium channel